MMKFLKNQSLSILESSQNDLNMGEIIIGTWKNSEVKPDNLSEPVGQGGVPILMNDNDSLKNLDDIRVVVIDSLKKLDNSKKDVDVLGEQVKKIQDSQDSNERFIGKIQNNFLQFLGFVVAFITFISVNITLYSRVKDLFSAMIFTTLLLLLLITFLLLTDLVVTHWNDSKGDFLIVKRNVFIVLIGVIIMLFVLAYTKKISLNPIVTSDEFHQEVEKIYNEQVNKNTDSLKTNFVQTSEFRDWKAIKSVSDAEYNIKQDFFKKCINSANNWQQFKICAN